MAIGIKEYNSIKTTLDHFRFQQVRSQDNVPLADGRVLIRLSTPRVSISEVLGGLASQEDEAQDAELAIILAFPQFISPLDHNVEPRDDDVNTNLIHDLASARVSSIEDEMGPLHSQTDGNSEKSSLELDQLEEILQNEEADTVGPVNAEQEASTDPIDDSLIGSYVGDYISVSNQCSCPTESGSHIKDGVAVPFPVASRTESGHTIDNAAATLAHHPISSLLCDENIPISPHQATQSHSKVRRSLAKKILNKLRHPFRKS